MPRLHFFQRRRPISSSAADIRPCESAPKLPNGIRPNKIAPKKKLRILDDAKMTQNDAYLCAAPARNRSHDTMVTRLTMSIKIFWKQNGRIWRLGYQNLPRVNVLGCDKMSSLFFSMNEFNIISNSRKLFVLGAAQFRRKDFFDWLN